MPKSNYFSILIGSEEDKMLNIVFQLALDNPAFGQQMSKHNLFDTVQKFRQSMEDGVKNVEWCNMKGCAGGNCEHKQ